MNKLKIYGMMKKIIGFIILSGIQKGVYYQCKDYEYILIVNMF